MIKRAATVLLLVIAIFYIVTSFRNKSTSNPVKEEFDFQFSLKDLNGQTVDFKEYRGKVLFINLWATWCGPCRREMPGIQRLYQKLESPDIAFIMLSVDRPEDFKKVKSYVEQNAYSFPVFVPGQSLPEQFNVPSIPTTWIVDRKGKVHKMLVGSENYDTENYRKLLTNLASANQ
ncbi:MAG: TlpA family protein disulfide reductase [Cyclobacteriaceae bacterium]|nr:TlpA family protein disulfide reductase [Cyclobacteriaceae bacterium]